jgi:hypothetical protein
VTDYAVEYIVLYPITSPHSVFNLSSYPLLIGLLLVPILLGHPQFLVPSPIVPTKVIWGFASVKVKEHSVLILNRTDRA